MSSKPEQPATHVFESPHDGRGSSIHFFLGGFCLVALAIVGFLAAARGRGGQMALHATTTLPILIAIGLFARGVSRRNTPSRIVVDPDGMEIDFGRDSRRYHWSEIGSATTANILNSGKTRVCITNAAGKTIVQVDESFPEHQRLVDMIQSHVDAKPDDDSIRILSRKARRAGLLTLLSGCCLATAAVFVALQTHETQRTRALLIAKGIEGEGEIVRRFIAPNGVTKRIEYRVAGSNVRNAEVHPIVWDLLENARTVPVVYVPDEPNVSRLQIGEVKDDDFLNSAKGGYILAALGGLMALLLLSYGPFAWKGYDLTFDEKDRAWKIKRYGRVVRILKKSIAP